MIPDCHDGSYEDADPDPWWEYEPEEDYDGWIKWAEREVRESAERSGH